MIRARVRSTLPMLIGMGSQILTLSASFLPIVFGLSQTLVYIVSVTAPVTILVYLVILGSHVTLPRSTSTNESRTIISSSLSGMFIFISMTTLILLAGLLYNWLNYFLLIIFGALILLPCQGLYLLSTSNAVRKLDYSKIMKMRVIYGLSSATLTLILCLFHAKPELFIMANSLSFVIAAAGGISMISLLSLRSVLIDAVLFRNFVRVAAAGRRVMISSFVGGIGGQSGSLVTPMLSSALVPSWAAAVRVTSGLQTLGGQILGPKIDILLLAAVRKRSYSEAESALFRGLVIGFALYVANLVGGYLVGFFVGMQNIHGFQLFSFFVGLGGYLSFNASMSAIEKYLNLIGSDSSRLYWDLARAGFGLIAVYLISSDMSLLWLGFSGIPLVLGYVWICKSRIRSLFPKSPGRRAAVSVGRL